MHLAKFINSESGKILMSIILGLGLATLFKITCNGVDCIIYKAPEDILEMDKKTYKYNNECYKFQPIPTSCDKHKKIVKLSEPYA